MPTMRDRASKASSLTHAEMDANLLRPVTQKTTTYQVLISDDRSTIEGNHATTAFTITLPPVATADNSEVPEFWVRITNINAAVVTVDGSGAETIDGSANFALPQWASITVQLDSAQAAWKIIASNGIDGNLTVTGFTSTGIDDNATGERVQIGDSTIEVGASGATYNLVHKATDQLLLISGDQGAAGGVIVLYGGSHATLASDVLIRSSGNAFLNWDESAGDLKLLTGAGSKTLALTLDSSQDATFAGDVTVGNFFNIGSTSSLTISSGAVTATASRHSIDTESSASTDDLDTINGGTGGDILIVQAANGARTVVCKDATGNLQLAGDFSINSAKDMIMMMYDNSNWVELSRSDNGT